MQGLKKPSILHFDNFSSIKNRDRSATLLAACSVAFFVCLMVPGTSVIGPRPNVVVNAIGPRHGLTTVFSDLPKLD